MLTNLSVWHKLLLVVLIPLLFQIVFVLSLGAILKYAQQESDRYEQSKDILLHFHTAASNLIHCTTSAVRSRDFFQFKTDLRTAVVQMRQTSAEIKKSAELRPELGTVPDLFDQAIALAQLTTSGSERPHDDNGRQELTKIRRAALPILLEFQQISKQVLYAESKMATVAPQQLAQITTSVVFVLVVGMLLTIAISAAAAYIFVNDILKRLRIIENNARMLGIRSQLSDLPRGRDEIGILGKSLEEADRVLTETRRKELAILDVASDVMCSIDRRFRITAIGAGAFQSWGYNQEELLAKSLVALQTKASAPLCRAALERLAESGVDGEFESELICKSGIIKDILWKVNWTGQTNSFYCVAHDISERRAAERMKQRFIAIVSHDLRTPLSSISATLSLLNRGARGSLSQEGKNILHKAESSLERLMELIRDLLDLEKLEAGKVVMELRCVSAQDVCSAACDSVEFLAKSLDVNISRPHKDSAIIRDERRLVRVMINLLSNAIKFSPRGGTVTVSLQDLGTVTESSVEDNGPGIAVADREIIFEKFRQTKTQPNAAVKGTGLGLAIAKLIVEGHGGAIGVKNEGASGSCFFMHIPNYVEKGEAE